ncbi:MAG: hypothetical protein HYY02_11800 [Chloroflexi bacterium]|nr:hypothetical protein [Chloroflexota bacterium]
MATEFERQLEELLKSLGDIGPKETAWQRFRRGAARRWSAFQSWVRNLPRAVPADQLMLAAIIVIIAAFFLRFVLPSAARFIGLAGLVLFIAAFVFSFNQLMRRSHTERRWRGQPVDTRSYQPSLLDRLVLWLRRKRRGY